MLAEQRRVGCCRIRGWRLGCCRLWRLLAWWWSGRRQLGCLVWGSVLWRGLLWSAVSCNDMLCRGRSWYDVVALCMFCIIQLFTKSPCLASAHLSSLYRQVRECQLLVVLASQRYCTIGCSGMWLWLGEWHGCTIAWSTITANRFRVYSGLTDSDGSL